MDIERALSYISGVGAHALKRLHYSPSHSCRGQGAIQGGGGKTGGKEREVEGERWVEEVGEMGKKGSS